MIRFILIAAVVVLVVLAVRSFLKRQKTAVVATSQGVALRGWGIRSSLAWEAVCRIDVERMPSTGVVFFCVVLTGARGESLAVYGDFPGFARFQKWMFYHWPSITEEWLRILSGPPNISERETLWKKDGD